MMLLHAVYVPGAGVSSAAMTALTSCNARSNFSTCSYASARRISAFTYVACTSHESALKMSVHACLNPDTYAQMLHFIIALGGGSCKQ
jgi:hypothetical protein